MRKLLLPLLLLVTLTFAVTVLTTPGPHTIWSCDTLKKSTTHSSAYVLYTANFTGFASWFKTVNRLDSTFYRVSYKVAAALSDTFAAPNDSLGAEYGNTIIRLHDTLWHYNVTDISAPYIKIFLTSITGNNDSTRIWLKAFLIK